MINGNEPPAAELETLSREQGSQCSQPPFLVTPNLALPDMWDRKYHEPKAAQDENKGGCARSGVHWNGLGSFGMDWGQLAWIGVQWNKLGFNWNGFRSKVKALGRDLAVVQNDVF